MAAHSGIIPHVHVFHMVFTVPNSVGIPGWFWLAGFITGVVVFWTWLFWWMGKEIKKEDEIRIEHVDKALEAHKSS